MNVALLGPSNVLPLREAKRKTYDSCLDPRKDPSLCLPCLDLNAKSRSGTCPQTHVTHSASPTHRHGLGHKENSENNDNCDRNILGNALDVSD